MDKDATITFRVPQATRDALERVAASEHRSLSNLIVAVLTGYVARQSKATASRVRHQNRRTR